MRQGMPRFTPNTGRPPRWTAAPLVDYAGDVLGTGVQFVKGWNLIQEGVVETVDNRFQGLLERGEVVAQDRFRQVISTPAIELLVD